MIDIHSVIKQLEKTYGKALHAYSLHKSLRRKIKDWLQLPIKGQFIDRTSYFWGGLKHSLELDHLIQIAKFFDIDERTAGVRQLKKFHEKWEKEIDPLITDDLKKTILKIKGIRNSYLAHSDLEPDGFKTDTLSVEIEQLLPVMRKIVDIASSDVNNSRHVSDAENRVMSDAKEHTDYIFSLIEKSIISRE